MEANSSDETFWTAVPLHLLAGTCSPYAYSAAQRLLQKGYDPNVCTSDGLTPVHIAAAWGQYEMLKLLLFNGGNPELRDDFGNDALTYAEDNKQPEICKLIDWWRAGCIDKRIQQQPGVVGEVNVGSPYLGSVSELGMLSSPISAKLKPTVGKSPVTCNNDRRNVTSNHQAKHSPGSDDVGQRNIASENRSPRKKLNFNDNRANFTKHVAMADKLSDDMSILSLDLVDYPPHGKYVQRFVPRSPNKELLKDRRNNVPMMVSELPRSDSVSPSKSSQWLRSPCCRQRRDNGCVSSVGQTEVVALGVPSSSKASPKSSSSKASPKPSPKLLSSKASPKPLSSKPVSSVPYLLNRSRDESQFNSILDRTITLLEDSTSTFNCTLTPNCDSGAYTDDDTIISPDSPMPNGAGMSMPPFLDPAIFKYCDSLSDDELKRRLVQHGKDVGPITNGTRWLYVRSLTDILTSTNEPVSPKSGGVKGGFSEELLNGFGGHLDIPRCREDERSMTAFFDLTCQSRGPKARTWREGNAKQSFCYLLLDPRILNGLHAFPLQFGDRAKKFRKFVEAVFYVGKGKNSRPFQHLLQARDVWKKNGDQDRNNDMGTCAKINRIIQIWSEGFGIISVPLFHNTIAVEAYTREAAMIDSIGLKQLCNIKRGDYYGLASTWSPPKRRRLGAYLLYLAFKLFLSGPERQLQPGDIK